MAFETYSVPRLGTVLFAAAALCWTGVALVRAAPTPIPIPISAGVAREEQHPMGKPSEWAPEWAFAREHSQMVLAAGLWSPTSSSMGLFMLQERRFLNYPYDHVWPTAVRYLRVDRGYMIRDKDPDAGYILFEFPLASTNGTPRVGQASMELYRTQDPSGRAGVSIVVGTNDGPAHLPHAILNGLADKIRTERGQPSIPPTPPSPPSSPAPPQPPQKITKEP